MKKLLFIAAACAGITLFGGVTTDILDVKISSKTAVVNEKTGFCDYKGVTYTGKMELGYDDDGNLEYAECFLKDSVTKTEKYYDVTFNCASLCGKKLDVATVVATFECEDGSTFVCSGKGNTFLARKGVCNFCSGSTPSCYKVKNVSGNMAGVTANECGILRSIRECGSDVQDDDKTACWGSFTFKYNQKESSLY